MGSNTGEDFKVFCFSIYMLIAPLGGDSSPLTRLQFRGSVAESWNKKRGKKQKQMSALLRLMDGQFGDTSFHFHYF